MRYGHLIPKIYPTGVFIESIEQSKTSTESGGKNVITATLTNHTQQHFEILNGAKGDTGPAATIKEITAAVDANIGTPTVSVSESGSGTEKNVHFDFKNLKGEKGDITLTEEVKEHIDHGITAAKKYTDTRLAEMKMPLNPVCAYDMADVHTQKQNIYTLPAPIMVKDTPTIIGGINIYTANSEGSYYHIHSEMSFTGNAKPVVLVYRTDWKEGTLILWQYCNGTQDFTIFIPKQNYSFGVGVWMQGWAGYQVQPGDSVTAYKFTVTKLTDRALIDSSGNGNHATISGDVVQAKDTDVGAALSFTKVSLSRAPLDCIGVGKKWSHSRWIYVNAQKDKNKELYLWVYSDYDYCYTNMVKDDGIVSTLYVTTAREGGEKNTITVPVPDHWLHLVVMTDLQETSCRKIVYANGKKIDDKTINGNFKGWLGDNEHTDMWYRDRWVLGYLANQLFFDRHLTEAEILWLGRNPYYPVKRYSLAEYKADENRKLIEALKKG